MMYTFQATPPNWISGVFAHYPQCFPGMCVGSKEVSSLSQSDVQREDFKGQEKGGDGMEDGRNSFSYPSPLALDHYPGTVIHQHRHLPQFSGGARQREFGMR